VQRLERALGVRLLKHSTHHVSLTAAEGAVFLVEARQVLAQADRAARDGRSTVSAAATLRVGMIDSITTRCRAGVSSDSFRDELVFGTTA